MKAKGPSEKSLRDLIEIIQFSEKVAAKIHGVTDEEKICLKIKEEFARSKKYTASLLFLTKDGSKLRIEGVSLSSRQRNLGEKVAGLKLKEYQIDLNKSSIYRRVVKKGATLQVKVSDIIAELFPGPLARLISVVTGFDQESCILTPLKRQGRIVGAFVMSSTELAEHFVPSVKNLASHITNALELAEEISERKQAEERLRRLVVSQKEFIADISHELRTPLAVIKAVVESEAESVASPMARQFLLIDKKVDQITLILKNLMLASRLDIGQEKVRKTTFKLKYLLNEVLDDVIKEARREGTNLEVKISCLKDIKFHGDQTKMAVVMRNLLRNTILHSNGKPRISLKVKKHRNRLQLIVEDNNQPILKGELKKIFKRFYRGKSVRRKTAGSGLGLYISQRLVKLMKGKIWAENRKGRGNRLIVDLPASS